MISLPAGPGSPFQVGGEPNNLTEVGIGDLTGNGFLDIVATTSSPSVATSSVEVLEGDVTGNFAIPPLSFPVSFGPTSIAIADLNNDGLQDFATANGGSGNITVVFTDGHGGGLNVVTIDIVFPSSVAIGDLTGDGIADLAAASQNTNGIYIIIGVGLGGFVTPVFVQVDSDPAAPFHGPVDLAIGDINLDGFLDIVTANQFFNTVSVLVNDGIGRFTPAASSPFLVGQGPTSVAIGDADGDGRPDVFTANSGDGTISLLLNTP